MSAYGPGKLSPLDDSQRGWSKLFVVSIVLVLAGVLLVPVTFLWIYKLNGRYCNDTNAKVVSDAWLDLASDSRTYSLTTAPEPGCDEDDPTPSVAQDVAVAPGSTTQAALDADRAALEDLGWIEHGVYAVGQAPEDSDGYPVPNLCATLTRADGPVVTLTWAVSTRDDTRYELEMTGDRAGTC